MNPIKSSYKICMIGSAETGKTAFITRMLTGEYIKNYLPTLGVEIHLIKFHTNYGTITLNLWDIAGQRQFGGTRDGYYIQSDGALLFGSLVSPGSLVESKQWASDYMRVAGNTPIVRVANKVDLVGDIIPDLIKQEWILTSAKSNHNMEQVWLTLIRSVTGLNDTVFREAEPITPLEIQLNQSMLDLEEWNYQEEDQDEEEEDNPIQTITVPQVEAFTTIKILQQLAGFQHSKL